MAGNVGHRDQHYYYHYTDENGMAGISSSMMIYQSTDTEFDCVYGKTVYLTDLTPHNSKEVILTNNYGYTPDSDSRADYYIKIPKSGVNAKSVGGKKRVIFVVIPYNKPLNLRNIRGVLVGEHGDDEEDAIGEINEFISSHSSRR